MKHLLELHILQNFAPSNLNRDDTGSPKDALFGGYRRARISSQSLKRAVRLYFHKNGNLDPGDMALRSKRISRELIDKLVAKGWPEDEANSKVGLALGGVSIKVDAEGKSQYLLFLGQRELAGIVNIIDQYRDSFTETQSKGDTGQEKKNVKDAKKAAKKAVPTKVREALEAVLDGGKAVDVALFGRMLADLPVANQDAACQVAHAISSHQVQREFDFYTAVDDLKPDDNAGADMLGTVEFNSACFYRYIALDLDKFLENLGGDHALWEKGLRAFLYASVKAKPSGKQNSFAAHNDPEYVVLTVRQDADPRNLANAFEQPVRPSRDRSLTGVSLARLEAKWRKLEEAYGQAGRTFVLNLTDQSSDLGEAVTCLDDLVIGALQVAKSAMEV